MKPKPKYFLLLIAIVALGLGLLGFAFRETMSHSLDWDVIAAGGAPSTSGNISLNGTLGQSVIGASTEGGGAITLWAGYWTRGSQNLYRLYLPLVLKNP
jgi:hypothetical protein